MLSFIIRISILSFFILSYVLWVKAFRMKVNLRKIESSSLFYRQNWSLENARVFTWRYIRLVEVNWNTVLWALLFQYIQAMYTKYCFVRAGKNPKAVILVVLYFVVFMYVYICMHICVCMEIKYVNILNICIYTPFKNRDFFPLGHVFQR